MLLTFGDRLTSHTNKMILTGKVNSGFGESSGWMPEYIPWLFPGTLNIRLDREYSDEFNWIYIIETSYESPVKIAACQINNLDAFIIKPPLAPPTKSSGLIEIGCQEKLRDKLNLKNGDTVQIKIT